MDSPSILRDEVGKFDSVFLAEEPKLFHRFLRLLPVLALLTLVLANTIQ